MRVPTTSGLGREAVCKWCGAFVLWHGVEIGLCSAEGTAPQFTFRSFLDCPAIKSLRAFLCVMKTQRFSCHLSDNAISSYGCASSRQERAVLDCAGVACDVARQTGLTNQHEEETEGSQYLDCRNVMPSCRRQQFEVVF
mmetsp:Transcript_3460/g.6593  ORF Transcript_3460/g.6593 Transcript_3460/m.6593 type:complete len:139 (-) Transcript_3460:208-624(-)